MSSLLDLHPFDEQPIRSTDPTESYFSDIARIPLLTNEQERELTQSLYAVRQLIREQLLQSRLVKEAFLQLEPAGQEKRSGHLVDPKKRKEFLLLFFHSVALQELPKESELMVKRLLSQERKLANRLVESNVRLVISVARRYRSVGIEMIDLIQEGNSSLLRAVDLFDPTLGHRFSTYATYWIKQGVARAIADKATTIRIPAKMVGSIRKVRRTALRMEQELCRPPTQREIAEKTGLPLSRVKQALQSDFEHLSIDTLLGDQQRTKLHEMLPSSDLHPAEQLEVEERRALIRQALFHLSPREIALLRTRFVLEDGEFRTLEETGAIHDISRERARLIERSALRKLRQQRDSSPIRDANRAIEEGGR